MTTSSLLSLLLAAAACLLFCHQGVGAVNLVNIPACPNVPPRVRADEVDVDYSKPLKARMHCKLVLWPGGKAKHGVPHINSTNLDDSLHKAQINSVNAGNLLTMLHVHMPWISQATMDDSLKGVSDPCWLVSDHYINLYSRTWRIPLLTAHRLTPQNVDGIKKAKFRRKDYKTGFFTDLRLPEAQAAQNSYYSGDYEVRGHMVPAYDMKYDHVGYINTFVFSNIAPTTQLFEKNWGPLEGRVSTAVKREKKTVYAISGPVVDDPAAPKWKAVGHNPKAIVLPESFFKLILWCSDNSDPVNCKLERECYKVKRDNGAVTMNGQGCTAAQLHSIQIASGVQVVRSTRFLQGVLSRLSSEMSTVGKRHILNLNQRNDVITCNHINDTLWSLAEEGKVSVSLGEPSTPEDSLLSKGSDFWVVDIPIEDDDPVAPGTMISAKANMGYNVRIEELFPNSFPTSLLPNGLLIDSMTYDCTNSNLDIHINIDCEFAIILDALVLQNATVAFTTTIGSTVEDTTIDNLVFTGVWSIGSYSANFAIKYSTQWDKLYFKASSGEPVTIDIPKYIEDLTGVSIPLPFGTLSFNDVRVLGIMDTFTGGTATIALSADFSQGTIHIIPQFEIGTSNSQYRVAFAAELYNINFAEIVQKLTGTDISSVPFFGSLVISEMGITTTTGYVDSYILPRLYKSGSLLEQSGTEIDKGFAAYFSLRLADAGLVGFGMKLSNDEFAFEVYESLTLGTLLSKISGGDANSLPLPLGISDVISDILKTEVYSFVFNYRTKTLQIEAHIAETLTYFDGVLKVHQPSVVIDAALTSPTSVTALTSPISLDVVFGGSIEIGGSDYTVGIARDINTHQYVVTVEIPSVPVTLLVQELGAQILPDELNDFLAHTVFFSFKINDLYLKFPLASQPQQIFISGVPVIEGFTAPRLTCVVTWLESKLYIIQGFEFSSVNLAGLLQQLTGNDLHSVAILNQNVDLALLVSPITLPNVQLVGEQLNGFSIKRGVSLQAEMSWPPACRSDPFCNVTRALLGANTRFTLQTTYESITSFTLFAGIQDVTLGSGLTLSEAGLSITVGPTTKVGIEGSVVLSNPPLTFTGGIFVAVKGVFLELSMSGCWDKVFDNKWTSACNLDTSIALMPDPEPVVGLTLGGTFKIGDPSCYNLLVATGFVGIEPPAPKENFYYANLEGVFTFKSVLSAFCLQPYLPEVLLDSGFPNGFFTSFSITGKELPHVSIPQGFRFRGTFNILGLSGDADVRIGLPDGIYIKVSLPVLNLEGGLLAMYATNSDRSRGPYMNVDLTLLPIPNVLVEASGYVSVLGIESEQILMVTNDMYMVSLQGRMLNLFESSLTIYAQYGSISTAKFRVQGSFKKDLFSILQERVRNALQSAGNKVSSAVNAAQDEVNRKQQELDKAKLDLTQAQRKLDEANRALDAAVAKVQKWENEINSICTIKTCGSVCIGCVISWHWKHCCFTITDPKCLAANTGCYVLKKPLEDSLELAEKVVQKSRIALDAAKDVLEAAKHTITEAQHAFDVAHRILENIKQKGQVGLKAIDLIASVGLGGAINIEKLEFDVFLSTASGGSFSGSLTARFAGHASTTVHVHVNLHDITAMTRQLADHVVSGLSSAI